MHFARENREKISEQLIYLWDVAVLEINMRIGVPKEIKNFEFRVGLTPSVVRGLTQRGHELFVETQAGAGIGLEDSLYLAAGATIVDSADDVFEVADLIVKVKEPQPPEIARLAPRHTLFTYLHLAPDP